MAAQIAHILAGEAALSLAAPELAKEYGTGDEGEDSPPRTDGKGPPRPAAWFRLGCQGPDIFYHNQRSKPSGLHYGALAHRKNYGLIIEGALERLIQGEAELASPSVAWLLGFSTHAALDRATHPFIVAFSGWASPSIPGSDRYRSCHAFLERLLDLGLLADLRGRSGPEFGLSALLPSRAELGLETENLGELLSAGLRLAYPRSAGSDRHIALRMRNAFSDALAFLMATDPAKTQGVGLDYFSRLEKGASPRRLALIYPDRPPQHLDFMNKKREIWPHPAGDGRVSDEGFLELYAKGVEAAEASLGLVLDSLTGGALPLGIAAALGNGGLSVTDPAGIPVPPRCSCPLPLAELMEKEFEKRRDESRG